MARDVVGIDLGTTNTVIYRFRFDPGTEMNNTGPFSVPIFYPDYHNFPALNSTSLPSILYLEENGKGGYIPYTGDIAQQLLARNPNHSSNLLFNTKRLMGDDKQLEGGYNAQQVAEELYKVCFYSIKRQQQRLQPRQVCVTRPAAFDPFGINSTTDAADHALRQYYPDTLPILTALEEPQAALLSYLYDKLEDPVEEAKLLHRQDENGGTLIFAVLDVGGGTTDVTVQPVRISGSRGELSGGTYYTGYVVNFLNRQREDGRHADSNPNEAFGGLDFDVEVSKHLVQRLYENSLAGGLDLKQNLTDNARVALQNLAITRAKEYKEGEFRNGTQRNASWHPDLTKFNIEQSVEVTFTRQEYEQWVQPLCGGSQIPSRRNQYYSELPSVYSFVHKTLASSGYQASDLDCMYVTGGMSCYPGIREMIAREYGELTEIAFSQKPLLDIARGAALYDSYFHVERDQVHLNSSIMIDRPSGEAIVLAEKGVALPSQGSAGGLEITNPVEMTIDILRGASTISPDLTRIKTLRCHLPGGRMTGIGTAVDVSYEVTEEQRIALTLHVQDKQAPYDLILNANAAGKPEPSENLGYWQEVDDLASLTRDPDFASHERQQHYFLYKDLEEKRVLFFKNRFAELQLRDAQPGVYEQVLTDALQKWTKLMGKNISPLEPFLFALKLYDGILTDKLGDVREKYLDAIAHALLPYWDTRLERDNGFVRHILLTWNWFQSRAVIIRMYALKPDFTDPVVERVLRERLHSVKDVGLSFGCLLQHANDENLRVLLTFMVDNMTGTAAVRGNRTNLVTNSMQQEFRDHFYNVLVEEQKQVLLTLYEELIPRHRGKIRFLETLFHGQEQDPKYQKLQQVFFEYRQASAKDRAMLRREWDPTDWNHQRLCQQVNDPELLDEIKARLSYSDLPEVHRVGVLYWIARSNFEPAHSFILQRQKELDQRWEERNEYPYQWMEYALASNLIIGFPDWQRLTDTFFQLGRGYSCAREFRRRATGSNKRQQDGQSLREAVTKIGLELDIPPTSEEQRQLLRRFFSGVREMYTYPFGINNFPVELDQVLARALRYASKQDMILLDILLDVLRSLVALETRARYYNMLLELYNDPHTPDTRRSQVLELAYPLFAEGR